VSVASGQKEPTDAEPINMHKQQAGTA